MRFRMVIFLLFCYARVTIGKGNVTFTSKNFYNILTWDPADPRVPGETVRYSVFYGLTDDGRFYKKAECQNIMELFCDLTAETPADHDTYYKAKVLANGSPHGTTRRFKPIAETVLGAATLSYNTSRTSFHMNVLLPEGPNNESLKSIFNRNHKGPSEAIAVYHLVITKPLWAAQEIINTTGHFVVTLTKSQTEYCGYVVYTPVHEHGRPLSEEATFCIKLQGEENHNSLMVLPWLLLSVVVVAAAVSMAVCFAKRYVKDVKNYKLPTSLISTISPPQVMYPQKDQNISKPEMSAGSESEETQYAKIQWKPNVSSAEDEAYGHKNTIFLPWNEDSSLDTVEPHSPGLYQDDSAQSSDIYGAVAVSVVSAEENEDFHQHQLNEPDRNNTRLMSIGNGSAKSGQLLSTLKTIPLSTVDISDNNETQPLFLQTLQNSEGQLTLPMLSLQVSQPFTGTTEELVPPERKPLLPYLIVSSDKGENFVSLHSVESSECSDSGVDENTLPSPTQEYGNSQYLPTQLDLTHFSPSSQKPLFCDSGTHDSPYKENWMPSIIQETGYHWNWSGLKEECKEDD